MRCAPVGKTAPLRSVSKTALIPSFLLIHPTGTFCLPTLLQILATLSVCLFYESLGFRAVNPSRASCHSSDSRLHLHGNLLTLPIFPPLIPVRLARSAPALTPHPGPSHLLLFQVPVSFPAFYSFSALSLSIPQGLSVLNG